MEKKLIMNIAFNHIGYTPDRLTKEWIARRLDIFMNYTLRCLIAQSCQEFEIYLHCDPLAMNLVDEELTQYSALPSNIHFDTYEHNRKHAYDYIKESDYTYEIRLDSDNLYSVDYIERIMKFAPHEATKALVSQSGYMYDMNLNAMIHYFAESPPFYTLIYKTKDYLNGERYKFDGHPDLVNKYCYEVVGGDNFIVLIHEQNVSNGSWLLNGHKRIEEDEKKDILRQFNLA